MSYGGSNNRGPSIAELQRFIREKVTLVFTLNNGEKITGQLRWFDETAFQVAVDGQQPFTILRAAVVGYQKHGGNSSQAASEAKRSAPVQQDIAAVLALDKMVESTAESASEKKTDDVGSN